MPPTQRQEVEAILSGARAERAALLEQLSEPMRASLPVDATGIAQAIEHLAALAGVADELAAEQARGHQANAAVLHGRVFGRAPLTPDTVLAAFADGARVRAAVLAQLAEAIGGRALREEIVADLDVAPAPTELEAAGALAALHAAYATQEHAVVRLATALDDER
ncbi:MAG: hypothetical protein QOF86_1249 [Baekduia sp.]|jgi:hypothetical protein|nr:hypothetical protein [Baekduia sp.]